MRAYSQTAPVVRSGRFVIAAIMLGVAVLFGGGGSPAPAAELIVELAALALFAASLFAPAAGRHLPIDRSLVAGAALFVAIPVVQLIPLPPALWQSLPGRGVETDALRLVGQEAGWRPVSMSPYLTFASLLSLLPSLAMLVFVARLTERQRSMLLAVLAGLCCLSAAVGALQLAAGDSGAFRFYAQTNIGFVNGFQANRNQQADILLIGLLGMAAAARTWRPPLGATAAWAVLLLVLALFAFATVLTGSRAGVLLVPVAATGAWLLLNRNGLKGLRRNAGVIGFALVLALAGGVLVLRDNIPLARSLGRFGLVREGRTQDIWPDARYALRQYWPVGTGIGTFVPVFQIGQRLEGVDQAVVNRAHNDYLEFGIESGAIGYVTLLLLVIGAVARAMIQLRETSQDRRIHALFGLTAGLVLGLHSLVDYPMRSMSLAVVAGMIVGMLSRPSDVASGGRDVRP